MKVPPFLESAYQTDHKLASFVASALSKIDGHIVSNRMVYFPEYTDHGIRHLERMRLERHQIDLREGGGMASTKDFVKAVM
jgi:molecular chaperone HtpG